MSCSMSIASSAPVEGEVEAGSVPRRSGDHDLRCTRLLAGHHLCEALLPGPWISTVSE
jgi:hypothetical protein